MIDASVLRNVGALQGTTQRNPLDYFRPTPAQEEWLRDPGRVKLLRGANQMGKTYAQVFETVHRMRGTHPFIETHRPPIDCWIICHSWEQSVDIQRKFWEWLPKDELDSRCEFIEGKGFRGKTPFFRFDSGPGAGSMCRFKTVNQGTLGVASATVHYVGIDEPPPPEIWGELNARVLRHGGTIGLTMTPIGRPIGWLKELVDEGIVNDHQFSLTVANCTPRGLRPFVDEGLIETIGRAYLPFERQQRLHGAWEGAAEGRIFEAWDPDTMVSGRKPRGKARIGVGIDHGGRAGKQVAMLVAVAKSPDGPRVYVIDESVSDGQTSVTDDAAAIKLMCDQHQIRVVDVDMWRGDRPYAGNKLGVGRKSNQALEREFRSLLGSRPGHFPVQIRTTRKFPGSVEWRARVLHDLMIKRALYVDPRCVELIKALTYWEGRDDDLKDKFDAASYIIVDMLGRPSVLGTLRIG